MVRPSGRSKGVWVSVIVFLFELLILLAVAILIPRRTDAFLSRREEGNLFVIGHASEPSCLWDKCNLTIGLEPQL
jgi:hypothetical protein